MLTALSLSLIAANIAIHTQDARGASDESLRTLSKRLAVATALRTGESTSTTKRNAIESCSEITRCVSDVRVETGAQHVILLRVLSLPSRIRLSATLVLSARDKQIPKEILAAQEKNGPKQQDIDLNQSADNWEKQLAKLVEDLFSGWPKPTLKPKPSASGILGGSDTTISIITESKSDNDKLLWKLSWIGAGALLSTGGMITDAVLPSSHNQTLDTNDFIGPGMIVAGIIAGLTGIYLNPFEDTDSNPKEQE